MTVGDSMSRAEILESIFPGNSEMAHLMRAFDWSATEVGVPEKWPESLKAAVRICVGSRNPIVIWWGKTSLSQIYNDGYMRILTAAKHPQWLARSGAECWSEIMETMGPLWDQVIATGEATWFEDFLYIMNRNLPREECFFTFSYSALRNDSGIVDGILCICYETTSRVIGDGRLRTLRDLGRTVAIAKTPDEACKVAAEVLATNPQDIPFSLLYLVDSEATRARLVAATGFESEGKGNPKTIDLASDQGDFGWPLKRVLSGGAAQEVSDLPSRFGQLPGGSWPETPQRARIIPITSAGQLRGTLIAGFSTRRLIDADYRSFFDLVTAHISTAIANATAYEEERRRAEALAELDRAKTIFFSNVSHEFRTPLTLMLGPLEDELRENPNASERLRIAHRNSLRLLKLVNTLLDFARIEAGRARAVYEPTELASMTAGLASHFRSAIERGGVELRVECLTLEEPVYVDREMWEKIVLNLLSNAFKFTFEGIIAVRLQAAGRSKAELTVSDTGIGIEENELPHIFERFHQTNAARGRSYEGTGIGLALVQELVQLHGGTITAESTPGKGSIFRVGLFFGKDHLPPDQVGASRELASTATRAAAFVEEALRWLPDENNSPLLVPTDVKSFDLGALDSDVATERLLIVDDNADMRDHLRRLFSGHYLVSAAANGEEAFQLARTEIPDLVLADVMMPKLDGFGLLKALKSDSRTRGISVILLSARAGEEARSEGIDAGADDYIVKPFSARELLARVAARMRHAQRERIEEARRIVEQEYRVLLEEEVASRTLELEVRVAERDALLKEVHHRVKNNLHVIISMLEMQARRADDFEAFSQLKQACNRIMSVAQIHELLYQSGSSAGVDLKAYAAKLVPQLVEFYGMGDRVEIAVQGETVVIDLERAVPCGLILNELVANTCKHAFPEASHGRLTVQLGQMHGKIRIAVQDDGVGLPPGLDFADSQRVGLTIVRLLATRLGGSLIVTNGAGTCTEVQFAALHADSTRPA
jgi:signal transduction histidine kinase